MTGTRILAVDDDPTNLEILEEIFGESYEVTTASSGEEAILRVGERLPHVVLLDVMMPGIDGLEVCRRLRALPDGHRLKIILVSAKAMVSDTLQGYEAGADDYVSKPFVHAELRAKVRVFARLRSMEELAEERSRVNAELRQALVRAEEAPRAKDAFFANASHELRTPMAAVLGFTELLRDRLHDPEDREMVGLVLTNGKHLLRLVNDILDFAKVDTGHLQLEIRRVSPFELVDETVRALQVQARRKGIGLRTEFAGALPETIATDPTRCRQILVNLIANAIKFTAVGTITVRARIQEDEEGLGVFCCEVEDSGVGMSPEAMQRIFEPFAQGDGDTYRRFGGTGLGLPISRGLARSLGGNLTVRSAPGRGSVFTIEVCAGLLQGLPLQTEAEFLAQRRQDDRPGDGQELLPTLTGRILLAEDTEANQRLITHIISKAGASVTCVENGVRALDAIEQAIEEGWTYDLVLMDLQMPVLDGFDATRELRGRAIDIPVIALTASASEDVRARAVAAGCDAFAGKPIVRKELLQQVWDLMERGRGR